MNARVVAILGSVLVAVAALFAAAAPVSAHTVLIRSDPADGARLTAAPTQVTAWFSEPVETAGLEIHVVSGDGKAIDNGQVNVDPSDATKVTVGLTSPVAAGFYEVTWQTISRSDGHFEFGSFQFTLLNLDGSDPSGPHPTGNFNLTGVPTSVAEGAATKAAGLIGAALLAGALAATLFVLYPSAIEKTAEDRERLFRLARRFMIWISIPALVLLAIVGALELLLQIRQFGGDSSQVLQADWGQHWLWRQFTLGTISALLVMHLFANISYRGRYISLGAAFLAALNYLLFMSLVSHANAVGQGGFWATASDFIHLTAGSIWIGGLLTLLLVFIWARRALDDVTRPQFLAGAIWRFSLLAGTSLALLLITGLFNALVEVSRWGDLFHTAYGRALVVKLLLVVPLLVAAAVNGLVLRPNAVRERSQDAPEADRLRRLLSLGMQVEAALGVAVLVAVGILTQYTPSRVEAQAARVTQAPTPGALETRDAFAYPLVTGNWSWVVVGGFLLAAAALWVWSWRTRRERSTPKWALRAASVIILLGAIGTAGLNFTVSPSTSSAFNPSVAFRYRAIDGRFVLLQIDPFQIGLNQLRVNTTTQEGQPVPTASVTLQVSRLDQEATPDQVSASPAKDGSYAAAYNFTRTGWWAIEVVLDGGANVNFYLRLDNPSRAPLDFNPPDYQSDPAAEKVFRDALTLHRNLSALKWREELTSGLLAPTGIGAWVVSDEEAEAPGSVYWHVLSPDHSDYQTYWVGDESCTQDKGGTFKCLTGQTIKPLALDYMDPSTAFQFGMREVVDGEMCHTVLFYNPSQGAWYTWWVGIDSGQLRRQAMVAPGHFMLAHYFDPNVPIGITIPAAAGSSPSPAP